MLTSMEGVVDHCWTDPKAYTMEGAFSTGVQEAYSSSSVDLNIRSTHRAMG